MPVSALTKLVLPWSMCPAVPTIMSFMAGPLLILLLAAVTADAQAPGAPDSPAKEAPVFRAGVALVRVDAQALDREGRAIEGLNAEDFRIYDEGEAQTIVHFGREAAPLDLVLLLDISGSMRRHLQQLSAAAQTALKHLHAGDRVAVMPFARNARVSQELTGELGQVERRLREAIDDKGLGNGTAINDALAAAARYLGSQPGTGRRAILIITDNQSLNYRISDDDVLREMYRADAVLNGILTGNQRKPDAPRPGQYVNPDFTPSDIFKLAAETGGEAMEARRIGEDFARMIERIRERYSLGYSAPEGKPGAFRRIRVELRPETLRRHPGAQVRARAGYYTEP
jgi:VWFA-related protein